MLLLHCMKHPFAKCSCHVHPIAVVKQDTLLTPEYVESNESHYVWASANLCKEVAQDNVL